MSTNWDDLRIFLAIAKAGTVTGAGKQLGVAHTTISRRLSAFESQMEVRLFDRVPGRFVLTEAGEELRAIALDIESNFIEAERLLQSRDRRLSGTIRVSTPELMLTGWIGPYLKEFCESHPEIELQMVISSALMSLPQREMDVAIRFTNRPPETAIGRKLMPIAMAVYASKKYLAEHEPIRNLNQLHWIGIEPAERDMDMPFLVEHMPSINVRMRMSSLAHVYFMVKQGAGLARLPHIVGEIDPSLERVPGLPIEKRLDLWLLTHRDLRNIARIRTFLDFMAERIKKDSELYPIPTSDEEAIAFKI